MTTHKPIRVLVNSSEIVQVLAERGAMTPAEIAEAVGVPRPTAYRLVGSLNSVGLTRTGADSRVSLSIRWLHLADSARAAMPEWESSRQVLDDLVATTSQTAFLSVPRDHEAVCIDWAPGRGIGVLIVKPGRGLPYHVGAAGRAALAFSADDDVESYLAQAPFPRLTLRTLTTADDLRADIEQSRADGFTFSDEDVTVGIAALGMPILSPGGRLLGCVSIGGLAHDFHQHRSELLIALTRARDLLTAPFGGR